MLPTPQGLPHMRTGPLIQTRGLRVTDLSTRLSEKLCE